MTAPPLRIGLGTARWGSADGTFTVENAAACNRLAAEHGVTVADTAPVYGRSERLLGQIGGANAFRIFTKTPPLREPAISCRQIDIVRSAFERSLRRLNVDHVEGLLVHHAADLLAGGGDWLWEVFIEWRNEGRVARLGVCVNTIEQLADVREEFDVDIVQIPLSIFDQRALQCGELSALREDGIEVHTTSPFFHGLLLMKPSEIPDHFAALRERMEDYHQFRLKHNLAAIKAALSFAQSAPVDCVIVNAASATELAAVLSAAESLPENPPDFSEFACTDARLLTPTQWAA